MIGGNVGWQINKYSVTNPEGITRSKFEKKKKKYPLEKGKNEKTLNKLMYTYHKVRQDIDEKCFGVCVVR